MRMIVEANEALSTSPRLAYVEDENIKRFQHYCTGRTPRFVHPSLYRALKLTFPLDVGGPYPEDPIRSEMGLGSIGQMVGVLMTDKFNAEQQRQSV